ncbi:MAG: hypothetical protein JSV96_16020 [Candidatus Aminicenantes bacterium]|nr:MAG: hypothetical protein JSV96_16020 [Candidatus Aminicenantes bacterium]
MKKYIFWSILHKNTNIALNEDLSKYAQGDTFWKAMLNLCEILKEWSPSAATEESDINQRLKMYYETGINKVELFVEKEGERYAVKCANSRSFINAATEKEALRKYIETRAKTSVVNTGDKIQE